MVAEQGAAETCYEVAEEILSENCSFFSVSQNMTIDFHLCFINLTLVTRSQIVNCEVVHQ